MENLLRKLHSDEPLPEFSDEAVQTARAALASPDAFTSNTEALITLPPALCLALLEAAVAERKPRLAEVFATAKDKAVAKAAKKAIYQLRSLGMAVQAPVKAETAAARPVEAEEAMPSLISPVTGTGERALLVARPSRGGLEVSQIVIADEFGIVHCTTNDVSRGSYRRQLKEIREGPIPAAVETTLEEAKTLLQQAVGLNLSSRTPLPKGTDGVLRRLGVVVREEEVPPLPPPMPEDERVAWQGQELHHQPEIQAWLPPEAELRVLGEKMEQVAHSPLQLSETQKQEQWMQTFQSAATAFFTVERRRLYARRLWMMAEYFERTHRAEAASVAKAEARRLFHLPAGTPSRFADLFEKVLHLTMTARAEEQQKTGEAAPEEAPTAPAERRSPGGLILP